MTKRQKKFMIFLFTAVALMVGLLWLQDMALAQTPDLGLQPVGENIGLPTTDIRVVVARIIRTALGLLGIVAVVLIIYGGVVWMTAGGNEEKIAQAKKILVNAVIGLVIILSSYAIASFVISKLVGATTGVPEHCTNGQFDAGVETQTDCGGECPACFEVENPYFPGGIFYVDSLPQGGQICIRNVHLAVTFNRAVDTSTLAENISIAKSGGGAEAGEWRTVNGNTAEFVPNGDCGSGPSDCFAANTQYTLHFINGAGIKTSDGAMSLNCNVKAGCHDVVFTTGEGVDRQPPTITIEQIPADRQKVDSVIPITLRWTDDNGVQKLDLNADGWFVGSTTTVGCQKTGSVQVNWPTNGLASGIHTLQGTAYDWSMQQGVTTTNVNLKPAHCFDNVLDPPGEIQVGPPACGPDCGVCGGGTCTNNSDCASGDCENGVCVDRVRINGVSPLNGAPGTLVSISGYYFGTTTGKVFINNAQMPVAACGINVKNWTSNQIIAEVPQGAATGPIKVETAPDAGGRKFTDATNDDFGPRIDDFAVNTIIRPGVCGVVPNTDVPGADVVVSGKHFGSVPDKVLFGQLNAIVVPNNWSDASIQTKVPFLEPGAVAIKVVRNNVESNGVIFYVTGGYSSTTPIISNITPASGTKGEYITITGNNFGDAKGRVWFKLNNNGLAGEAIDGDLDSFPAECKGIWSDKQIIVKFPQGSGTAGQSYYVQVLPAEAGAGWSPIGPTFDLKDGAPSPGICNVTPVSGPVPFAASAPKMKIAGQYFGTAPEVYFWTAGASPDSVNNRIKVAASAISTTVSGKSEYLELYPPLGTQSGPVVAYRSTDGKMSNPVAFNVYDCVKNNNQCNVAGTKCCAVGAESGMCKTLCADETLSAGYIWRFCTKDIPQVPHVVERCDSGTDEGKNIPSPSPSIIWDVSAGEAHHNVCRTAEIVVEFSMAGINPISSGDLIVNKCDAATVDEKNRDCTSLQDVPLQNRDVQLSTEHNNFVELNPAGGRWLDNTWYQVVLKTGISAGSGTSTANLAADAPCKVPGSAYCFLFKTDARDCRMKAVVVTPYTYWTSVLEKPIKFRTNPGDPGEDVVYSGHGISDQHCIWMDVSGFDWSWSTSNTTYSDIYAVSSTHSHATVSAIANTVGVGLADPDNAVNINAVASTSSLSYTGHSPLTIDLSNPEVVDYWPNCLEACTDAEVGVRFNTSMSLKNLPGAQVNGTVQLLKCLDENCLDTEPVSNTADILFDLDSNNTILKIANSSVNSAELASNTIYKVILSAVSDNPLSASNQLWSAATLDDFNSFSKPYNKQFTWRFKTKKDKCLIARAEVAPLRYVASHTNDRKAYTVQPYSSPDRCSAAGQKLNPWKVNWNWASSDPDVARLQTFSSQGISPYCTNNCVKKGSSIASGLSIMLPVCGNNKVEAGEDCDPPNKATGCGLKCLRLGNTNTTTCGNRTAEPDLGEKCDPNDPRTPVGCNNICLHTGSFKSTQAADINASICGNGFIGSGEDCDLGIDPSVTNPQSSLGCSQTCLHLGTRLSSGWCHDNTLTYAGFSKNEYTSACGSSFSQCGNGITEPDEDPDCDLGGGQNAAACTNLCLKKVDSACNTGIEIPEGCSIFRKLKGSSLLYSTPSLCGDGITGLGEDESCEQGLPNSHQGMTDPWALAIGVGKVKEVSGNPPSTSTLITANTSQDTKGGPVGGRGWYEIRCGYASDSECKTNFGPGFALAANSCCYLKPNLADVYPGTTTLVQQDVCPNTSIEFEFDQPIDPSTLPGNLLIARGIGLTNAPALRIANVIPPANGTGLSMQGFYAYVTNGADGLHIIDISSTTNQHEVGAAPASGASSYSNIQVTGKFAYVTDSGAKVLRVFDISSSTNPVEIGATAQMPGEPLQVTVVGNKAYVAGGVNGGIRIVDISSSTNPVEVGSVNDTNSLNYHKIIVRGKYAYAVEFRYANVEIFDISSSTHPVKVGSSSSTSAFDLDIAGNYAYVASGAGLHVINIADPANPVSVGYFQTQIPGLRTVFAYNNLVFAGNSYAGTPALHVFDFTHPGDPVLLDSFAITNSKSLYVAGNFAYIITDSGVDIIEVSKYTNNCTGADEVTKLIARARTDNGNLPWYQRVWLAVKNFVKHLFGGSAIAQGTEPTKWCAGADLGTPSVISAISSTSTNRISVQLSAPLAVDTHYAIILKPGVRDKRGVSIGTTTPDKNIYWRFVTAGKLCEVTTAGVKPAQVYLSKVGATSTLEAQVFASNGQKIQPIKDYYYWEHIWAPANNPYVTLQDTKNSTNTISAQNRNGELDVRAGIKITDNKYTNIFGTVATGKSHVIVYLCENPWPPKDLFVGSSGPFVIFPYEDKDGNNDGYSLASDTFDNTPIAPSTVGGYFNFSTYYCADGGVSGTSTDDLPYLRAAVQISPDIVADTPTSSMKRFIFTNAKNADAIGVQIFSNNQHLLVQDWFTAAKEAGGQGFSGNMQGTIVDGYEAITDGNNIYVDSLNFTSSTHNLYTNIYLFSINADAQPETRKVFDQMMKNLSFNTNLTNYGYCGTDMNNPGDTTACKIDLDCPSSELCSVQKDKFKRNYQRLRDLNLLQTLIGQ
jgi:hypothetical protein